MFSTHLVIHHADDGGSGGEPQQTLILAGLTHSALAALNKIGR